MQRFVVREAARFVVGVLGAFLVAAAIAAVGEPMARTLPGFGTAFGDHLWHLVRLDLGTSAVSGLPALQELAQHLPTTLLLVVMGFAVALSVGGSRPR